MGQLTFSATSRVLLVLILGLQIHFCEQENLQIQNQPIKSIHCIYPQYTYIYTYSFYSVLKALFLSPPLILTKQHMRMSFGEVKRGHRASDRTLLFVLDIHVIKSAPPPRSVQSYLFYTCSDSFNYDDQ